MAISKHLLKNEDSYDVRIKCTNTGRVASTLWYLDVHFDLNLNILSINTTIKGEKDKEEYTKVAVSYLKNQLKKVKTNKIKVVVLDFYTKILAVKEVHTTSSGAPNLKEANARPENIKIYNDDMKEKFVSLESLEKDVERLGMEFNKAVQKLREESQKIWGEI